MSSGINRGQPQGGDAMYSFEYPKDMNVGRVCLEMSLKPFKSLEQSFIEEVCTELFDQWKELLIKASVVLFCCGRRMAAKYWNTEELDDEIEWAVSWGWLTRLIYLKVGSAEARAYSARYYG